MGAKTDVKIKRKDSTYFRLILQTFTIPSSFACLEIKCVVK